LTLDFHNGARQRDRNAERFGFTVDEGGEIVLVEADGASAAGARI